MFEEIWKDIEGYVGLYKISNLGRVYSYRSKRCLTLPIGSQGYRVVALTNNKIKHFKLHRLLAQTFINNPKDKPCVNHIDGVRHNNQLWNLEWCTYKENTRHAFDTGAMKNPSGEGSSKSKLKDEDVLEIRKMYAEGELQSSLATRFNVTHSNISSIVLRKSWKHL